MPTKSDGIIVRDKLLRFFDDLSEERIIYVCAPAGYGKTVAVRQWLKTRARAHAVISFDEYDNNTTLFCKHFCAALSACQPQNTRLSEIVTHPEFNGAPDEFTVRAIAALSDKERYVLFADDLHFVTGERVLRLMQIFLSQLPEAFQIILASRNELPPGFSDLWIKGHLAKVTAKQILFSDEDIVQLYNKRGNSLTMEQAADIRRFTSGWAIGINALLLSGGEPSGENLNLLHEFIRNNVWELWNPETREFMLKTAMAGELTASLCTALTGTQKSEDTLHNLMMQNAFISCENEGVYRYHHLFQAFLQRMMMERGDDFVNLQLEKAGDWYLSQSDFYNAMDCFVKCENQEGIAKCFGLLVSAGQAYTNIERMISVARVPIIDEVAMRFPFIYSVLSWAAFNEGRADDMARYADLYYANQHEIVRLDPRLQFNIVLVRLIDFRLSLHDLMQAPSNALVNFVTSDLKDMGVSLGIINQNMPLLHCGTRDFSQLAVGNTESNVEGAKAALGGLFGDRATLLAECLTAGLLYEQGQHEKAYVHALAAIAEINGDSAPEAKFCAMSVLVYILDALSLESEAEQAMARIASMIEQDRAYYLNRNFNSLVVRRKLGSGDMEAAKMWLSEYKATLHSDVNFYEIYASFTTCRAYIAAGDYDSAIIRLTKILKIVTSYNRPLGTIEAQVLLAISYWKKKRGFQSDAMRHLKEAVSLAYNYGYIQMLAIEGAELCGMLRRLQRSVAQRGDADIAPVSFIKKLYLKALEYQSSGLTTGQAEKPVKFTDKQKAVIKLLCEGKSYREITEIIGIKLPTLRSHIALIYKKLDVTSETDAITKIKQLDIFSEV